MANINIILEAGLTNDYGVFNLNLDMIKDEEKNCLSVDIISDGDQFVESENSEFQHGGNTNYKDHEGIKPIDSNIPNWRNYGSRLVEKLRKYLNNLINNTYALGELWEDYKKYNNQFEVIFSGKDKNSSSKDYEYISYNNQLVNASNKKTVTYTLEEGYKGIGIETYIIHFSKYYNVYQLISGSQKILRPLLYYSEDLDTYNIGIKTNTINNETTYEPYLKYLTCLNFYRDGANRKERLYIDLVNYNKETGLYNCNDENNITNIISSVEDNDSGHHWSQFRTNLDNRPTFETKFEEQLNKMPTGFFLLGFYGKNNGYWFDKTNTGKEPENEYLPTIWIDTFSGRGNINVTTHRKGQNAGLIGGDTTGNKAFIGLMYRYDKNKNWHIFNSYFPIELPLQHQDKLNLITQNISYNSSAKYPKTLGLVISSILTSMYIYKDESVQNIKYISDIIFLEDCSTTYTKDIVYKIYKSKNKDKKGNIITDNDLLLFNKMKYNEYISLLQEYTKEDNDKTFSNNNINATIKSGVKNIPLQFKLDYLQPKLDNIGDIASVRVCTITGEEINCSNDIIKPNELYYLDNNNNINNINSNFTIKWLKSLEEKDNKVLLGKLDPKLENTSNSYIQDMFNYDGGNLGFNTNEIINKGISRYSIKTNERHANTFFDLLTNDILLPTARIF